MEYKIVKLVTVFVVLTATVQPTFAACGLETIKGNFAGESFFPESERYWPSHAVMMINFNGAGKIVIKKITEGSNGTYVAGNGGGNYSVSSNCTGVATITVKRNGVVAGKGRMDFAIGGTKGSPEILGTYTNTSDNSSGNVRLIKSSF